MTREYFEISAAVYAMLNIAQIAVEVDELERAAELEKADLKAAYATFKQMHGFDHIERDSKEWQMMIVATDGEYNASEAAKRKVYNAKRRLKAAIAAAR